MMLRIEKAAATRVGLSLAEYRARRERGLKRCIACEAWKPSADFQADASRGDGLKARCRECSARHTPNPRPKTNPLTGRPGPVRSDPRDGDQKQARRKVNLEVRSGRMPRPGDLACVDCGHLGSDRRHEYDHHNGYSAAHHYDVVPVCSSCHSKRTFRK